MNIKKSVETQEILWQSMRETGYCREYIMGYAVSAHEKCCEVPVDTHAHQFRHAKASHWLEDGINVVQISFLLGHENLNTTMKYLDITTEEKIKALATLETEEEHNTPKKWRNNEASLTSFLGFAR